MPEEATKPAEGYKYHRVLLKLSGEALMGDNGYGIDPKVIDDLCIKVQPYTLMLYGGEGMEIRQRDIKRAEIVRDKLKE